MSTFCHGVASAQAIDKSGEIVEIKGLDITSLPRTGIVNYEHKSDVPGQICGKILTAKKIFTKDDCSNDHELRFWEKCKVPFVYITAELLDDYCQSGKDAAGLFRYSKDNPDKEAILGFSVEGSEIPGTRSQKAIITRSIARKVTLTASPCNSLCVAEILESPQKSQIADDFEEIFKSQENAANLFKSGEGAKMYEDYLAKKEIDSTHSEKSIGFTKSGKEVFAKAEVDSYSFTPDEHKDAAEHHRHAAITASNAKEVDHHLEQMKAHNRASIGKSIKKSEKLSWSAGKVQDDTVHYHHPEHGVVSIQKQPNGEFHVKHNGALAGVGGVKGVFSNPKAAGAHAKKYMAGISEGKVRPNMPQNHPSPSMVGKTELKKAIEAGSYNASPSTLTNGAAYQTENLARRQANTGEDHNFQATKKGDWNKRAKQDYKNWPQRKKFEEFMKARMPHLKDGEIEAIGRVLSLRKSISFEKSLEMLINKSETPKLGNHFLFSAEKPMHPDKNELKMDHKQTLAHLKEKGLNAHEVKGHYGEPETSIMVHNVNPKQAEYLHGLASKLGQDSSIYSNNGKHEMRYHHGEKAGKIVRGEGTTWHKEKPKDKYTTMPNGQHFTHHFNFEKSLNKSEKSDKELDSKSLKDIQKETAETWAERAETAYKKAIEEKSVKWLLDADEFFHEAIEHSSLSEDLSTFEKIRAKLMPIRKEAIELLAPGAEA